MTDSPAPRDDSVEASLARTAQQYDDVQYTAIPIARMHPARLCALGKLFGLTPRDATRARTLEIGCATGGHLIPVAATYPEARFVGIDVSSAQIEDGRRRLERLGLGNIELQARSLTDLGPQDGVFDYIICHGVYSWVPEAVRKAVMGVVAARLAPNGIAVVSFNVLPGWRMFQVVRDSMILHAADIDSHPDRMTYTRHLFEMMEKHSAADTTYGQIWRKEATRMSSRPDFYLAHELFEDNNTPLTFRDFMDAATANGLAYLAETRITSNIPENASVERASLIRNLGRDELVTTEQYIDIVTGRTFRESMLIHAALAPQVDRSLDSARLMGLHLITPSELAIKDSADGGCILVADDAEIVIQDRDVAEALRVMIDRRPATTSLPELASRLSFGPQQTARLASVVMSLVCRGQLEVTSEPLPCKAASERPRAWGLAASDAAAGMDATVTMDHGYYKLTPFARFLLPLLDGDRSQEDLAQLLAVQALSGASDISDANGPVKDPARIREIAATMVDRQIASFARAGLLA